MSRSGVLKTLYILRYSSVTVLHKVINLLSIPVPSLFQDFEVLRLDYQPVVRIVREHRIQVLRHHDRAAGKGRLFRGMRGGH